MKDNIKLLKKIRNIKGKTRDKSIRIKLELFILTIKLKNISEACSRRGFGRTFYYKWWKRFQSSGFKLTSLEERTRRPKKSPKRLTYYFENKIREMNAQGYGARMIEAMLEREGKKISKSVISHVLNGRIKPCKKRKKILKAHRKRYELPIPGQRIQIDVKYVPKLIRGRRAYCFSAVDECTRIKFSRCFMSLSEGSTYEFLEEMKTRFPFPINTIQTDNGFEFTNRLNPNRGSWKHQVEIWCEENEVYHRCIPPGVKELNGKIERSHRIDEQYFYWRAPEFSLEALNQEMDTWLRVYNYERPHGGINYMTPFEKLQERMSNLPIEKLDDKLIKKKLRFLKEVEIMLLILEKPTAYRRLKMAA